MALPELYRYGRESKWFGTGIFLNYMFDGVYQSAVVFFLILYTYKTTTSRTDGFDVYIYEFSTTMVVAAVMCVNAFHGISTAAWTGWVWFAVTIGVILIWLYTAVYSALPPSLLTTPVYGNDVYLFPSAYYWFCIIIAFCVAMLPRYLSKAYRVLYMPNDIDIVRIDHKYHPTRDYRHDPLAGGRFNTAAETASFEEGKSMRRRISIAAAGRPHKEEEEETQYEEHPLRQRRPPMASTTSLALGSRTDMSTGLQLTPSRGFDFSTEEGGVAMRRIQTGLSERHGAITGPSHPPTTPPHRRRKGTMNNLFPSSLRKSLHRKSARPLNDE